MNETKKLLQLALEVMDRNSGLAAIVTRKALKQLDDHNDKKWKEWMNELQNPGILLGKVF